MQKFLDIVCFDDFSFMKKQSKKSGMEFAVAENFSSADEIQKAMQNGFRTCLLLNRPDNKKMNCFSQKTDFVAIKGGSIPVNRQIVSDSRASFLFSFSVPEKANVDVAIVRTAKQQNVSFAVSLSGFFSFSTAQQAELFRHYLLVAKLCRKLRVKFFVFSFAKSPEQLKTVSEIVSFGEQLGFSESQLLAWHGEL